MPTGDSTQFEKILWCGKHMYLFGFMFAIDKILVGIQKNARDKALEKVDIVAEAEKILRGEV
jgi:hypothetical protein